MAEFFDPATVITALKDALEDEGIAVQPNRVGELPIPCVQILPPAIGIDDTEEGFDVAATSWTLLTWYAAPDGSLDTVGELSFAMSVLGVLRDPSNLPAHVTAWVPGESPEPAMDQVGDEAKANMRHLLRRIIPLTIYHT